MPQVLAFIRLQLLACKPYLRSILLVFAFAVIFGVTSREPYSLPALFTIYMILFITYPFAIGEKNNLDILFATLSLNRKQVVSGLYILIAGVELTAALLALLLAQIIALIYQTSFLWSAALFTVACCFLVFSLIVSLQLPFFFKLGYTKAKLIAYLPLMLLALPAILLPSLKGKVEGLLSDASIWIEANSILSTLAPLAAGLILLLISGVISYRIYQKRDF